jgi:hypothetical protein
MKLEKKKAGDERYLKGKETDEEGHEPSGRGQNEWSLPLLHLGV